MIMAMAVPMAMAVLVAMAVPMAVVVLVAMAGIGMVVETQHDCGSMRPPWIEAGSSLTNLNEDHQERCIRPLRGNRRG